MTTKIRVIYSKKIGDAGTYSSTTIGGEVEFDIPKNADWQEQSDGGLAALKLIVDSQIEQLALTPHGVVAAPPAAEAAAAPVAQTPTVQPAATANAEAATAEVPAEIPDPETLMAYSAAKVVFDPEQKKDVNGKDYITVRLDHEDIPGRYRHGKSYDTDVMHAIETLRKGDRVDISGKYERPWTDSKGLTQAALIVEEVERVKPDAAAAK